MDSKAECAFIVERSFAITHAVAEILPGNLSGRVEVHVKVNNQDIILCHLHPAKDLLQERLDLQISEGEAVVFYIKTQHSLGNKKAIVHLSGYLCEEPTDTQWEGDFTDYDEGEEEEEEEEEESDVDGEEEVLCNIIIISC